MELYIQVFLVTRHLGFPLKSIEIFAKIQFKYSFCILHFCIPLLEGAPQILRRVRALRMLGGPSPSPVGKPWTFHQYTPINYKYYVRYIYDLDHEIDLLQLLQFKFFWIYKYFGYTNIFNNFNFLQNMSCKQPTKPNF